MAANQTSENARLRPMTVKVSEEEHAALTVEAERDERTVSAVVRRIIREWMTRGSG